MHTELFIAILAGLGGMLGWGFADFCAKKTIDEIGDMGSLAWGHVFGTLILFTFVLYKVIFTGYQVIFPSNFTTWFILLFFGVLQAVVYFFVYKAFAKGQVSILSPIFATFSGITAVLAIIFFGERVNQSLIFSLIIVFTGIMLVNLDINSIKNRSIVFNKVLGLREIVVATLLASLWTLLWGKFVSGQDWLLYALLMYAFMTFAILANAKYQSINLSIKNSSVWKFVILIGLGEVVAYLAISFGYSSTGYISIIALLSSAFSLPVLILARIFLKEKITTIQTVGSIVIIIGVMILSLV